MFKKTFLILSFIATLVGLALGYEPAPYEPPTKYTYPAPEPAPYEPAPTPAPYGPTCPDDDPKIQGRYLKNSLQEIGGHVQTTSPFLFHIFDPPPLKSSHLYYYVVPILGNLYMTPGNKSSCLIITGFVFI